MIYQFESLTDKTLNKIIYKYLIHHYGWNVITDESYSIFSGGTDSGMILSSFKDGKSTNKDFDKLNFYAETILNLVLEKSFKKTEHTVIPMFGPAAMKRCFWNYYHSNSCAEEHFDTLDENHWSIIYYLNDVKGAGTRVIDKETNEEILVPSVAGNAVLFPSHYIHTGTPPSNLDHRCCLNIIFESQHHV